MAACGLVLISMGLRDELDMSLRALEEARRCDRLYMETYTTVLDTDLERVSKLVGKPIQEAPRSLLEEEADKVLSEASEKTVGIIVGGDCLAATTHVTLLLEASRRSIPFKVVHGSSIYTAVSETGLFLYKFGRSVTMPVHGGVDTPYNVVCENLSRGLHTLVLLEADRESGEYVSVGEAVERLLEAEERVGRGVLDGDTLMVGAARIGWEDQLILADRAEHLAKTDFGRPPHVLVVPGNLHFMEAEALKALAGCPEELLREGVRTLRTTAEVVRRYLRSVDRVLGEVRRSAETLDERAKGVFEEAERYFMDAKHYFDRGDLTTALSAVAYSEGLLDALRMMGLIEFRW